MGIKGYEDKDWSLMRVTKMLPNKLTSINGLIILVLDLISLIALNAI